MGEYMERGQGAPEQATDNKAATVPPLAWEPLLARGPPVRPENALPCFNIILTQGLIQRRVWRGSSSSYCWKSYEALLNPFYKFEEEE